MRTALRGNTFRVTSIQDRKRCRLSDCLLSLFCLLVGNQVSLLLLQKNIVRTTAFSYVCRVHLLECLAAVYVPGQ